MVWAVSRLIEGGVVDNSFTTSSTMACWSLGITSAKRGTIFPSRSELTALDLISLYCFCLRMMADILSARANAACR